MKITPRVPHFGSSFILTMRPYEDLEAVAKKLPVALQRANSGLYDPRKFYIWADTDKNNLYVVCHDEDDKFFRRSAEEHLEMLYHWCLSTGLYIWITQLHQGRAVTSKAKFEEAVSAVKQRQPAPPEVETDPTGDPLEAYRDFFEGLDWDSSGDNPPK